MEPFNSFPEESFAYLFGLGVSPEVHHDWLKAATTFQKIRERLETDAVKLKHLRLSLFHRSTKKKLFKTSMENAADGKIESLVLLPLIRDDSIPRAQSLCRLILVCYSFNQVCYENIINNGLAKIFPGLIKGIMSVGSLDQEMRLFCSNMIKDIWDGKNGNERILGKLHLVFGQLNANFCDRSSQ